MKHIHIIQTILYVQNQDESKLFYARIFKQEPNLHVPGMTEFHLAESCKIGLMPNTSIAKILAEQVPHPELGTGIPRCELYLYVENIEEEYRNALASGARLISPIDDRNWGDKACYFADPDGHILAFAQKIS